MPNPSAQGDSEESAALRGVNDYQKKCATNAEVISVLASVIEKMDKLARKTNPQLGITDSRYPECFDAIHLRNKLTSTAELPDPKWYKHPKPKGNP